MKKYVKLKTNTVHYIADIRTENPNMSIPDDADCSSLGFEFLEETVAPTQDGFYAVELTPINCIQQWELKPIEIQIPHSITPRQIRAMLNRVNKREQVETLVSQSLDYDLKDWWEYSTEYKRDNEILISFAINSLAMSDDDIDNFFIEASNL